MKEFNRKYYTTAVFDLDGTVLLDGKMSAAVADSLLRLKKSGIKTAIGSGRGLSQISGEVRSLFDCTISANGGLITDNANGNVMYSAPFSFHMLDTVIRTAEKYGGSVFCFLHDWMLGTEKSIEMMRCSLPLGEQSCYRTDGEDRNVISCDDVRNWLKEKGECPCKMQAFFSGEKDCANAVSELTETGLFTVLDVGRGALEITAAGISKGSAIALLDDPKKTVAFGDSVNDLEMLKKSGYAVVVENGCLEAKSIADYIAPDVRYDGVAKAIKELFGV